MATAAPSVVRPRTKPLSFLSLPSETQHDIFAHCDQNDLICLALVSKHFHEVASAHLYRNFHIVFPDGDDEGFYSSIDGLAVGLDTFSTAEYNYAAHLRDLLMDTLSAGRKAERTYQPYLYSSSCGKFLNTLVLMTLKRAHSLESFRWNIRVELSRPVYAQLHRIKTLKTLHLRIQDGESCYITPPPLPAPPIDQDQHYHPQQHHHHHHHYHHHHPPPPPIVVPHGIPFTTLTGPPPPAMVFNHSHSPKPKPKPKRVKNSPEPPTLSGFKGLKSLAVLDIDSLDLLPELSKCIQNSTSTLDEIQLSFSDGLAQGARRPLPDSDTSDSEEEDNYENTAPARAYRAQEERKAQERVLAYIFGLRDQKAEHPLRAKRPLSQSGAASSSADSDKDARTQFIESVKLASENIMKFLNGGGDDAAMYQETLDIIERAAKKYVDEGTTTKVDEKGESTSEPKPVETQEPKRKDKAEGSPEDIDIEHLETVADNMDQFDETDHAPGPSDEEHKPAGEPKRASTPEASASVAKVDCRVEEARYARCTRGIALRTLKIHLVPVKASVLMHAFDVSTIRELTLLNVGNQSSIWHVLASAHAQRPLALRSVFTDHVTQSLLSLLAALPDLHDLFMLERSPKHKPESFAMSSGVTMDEIRRTVLKKHMHNLKRLMIKDESGPAWDVNEKTMVQICTRGEKLEELALSMNIHAVHAFMQYFPSLTNLRAINILHFRNHDTCNWVMREIMRFMVDNVSHHPELSLEWIAMEDDRVDHIVPADEPDAPSSPKKAKRKGKAVQSDEYPLMPALDDNESESDDEPPGSRLRVKTVGPLQFYDVWGVKIFEKEIRSGTL